MAYDSPQVKKVHPKRCKINLLTLIAPTMTSQKVFETDGNLYSCLQSWSTFTFELPEETNSFMAVVQFELSAVCWGFAFSKYGRWHYQTVVMSVITVFTTKPSLSKISDYKFISANLRIQICELAMRTDGKHIDHDIPISMCMRYRVRSNKFAHIYSLISWCLY